MEQFKNKHLNNDIYVICSGKSLDYIDKSFFENKITIGINRVNKYTKTNYIICKELTNDFHIDENTTLFLSKHRYGNIHDGYNKPLNNSTILFNHDQNIEEVTCLPSDDDKILVSYSTVTSGIHLACYMGASNIILVGHDCGTLDGELNFKNYHSTNTLSLAWGNDTNLQNIKYKNWVSNSIEHHTIKLKNLIKIRYKCNLYSLNPFINFNLENHVYKK